jgi:hypothetical protein
VKKKDPISRDAPTSLKPKKNNKNVTGGSNNFKFLIEFKNYFFICAKFKNYVECS